MKSSFLFQLILYICVIYSTECRTYRRQTSEELIRISSGTTESCVVGEHESEFGGGFRVKENSNVTIRITINRNHPSLIGESLVIRIFKDNTNIPLMFPNSFGNYPIDAMLSIPGQPDVDNLFLVYEFGNDIVALKFTTGQTINNGQYKVEVGTLNTQILASVTSDVEFFARCQGDPNTGVITTDETDAVYEGVGSYTHKFGGSVFVPTGSNVSLRILYNENHPDLEGEVAQVLLNKDGVQLMSVFSPFVSEGEFELEPATRALYPKIFIRYDHGFVYNSLVIREGNPSYNGDYTLEIRSRLRPRIATATTRVEFAVPDSIKPPLLKRSSNEVFVYNKLAGSSQAQGLIGDSFVVLNTPLNVISIIAEDVNNNHNINWRWYFNQLGGNKQRITSSQDNVIMSSGNSTVLIIRNGGEERLGVYTVEARNNAGIDKVSSQLDRLMIPEVRLAGGVATRGAIRIGENVDIDLPANEVVVIVARQQTGFPSAETSWFFSQWRGGERKKIQNSEDFEIISDLTTTRLVVKSTTRVGFGYIYAVADNLAGVDEAYTILGKAPVFRGEGIKHEVRGFVTGQIGDTFKLSRNSLFSIEARPEAYPPVTFSWFKLNPLDLYSEETEIVTGESVIVGDTLNKSVMTRLTSPRYYFVKYFVRVSNELGSAEESSYVICN